MIDELREHYHHHRLLVNDLLAIQINIGKNSSGMSFIAARLVSIEPNRQGQLVEYNVRLPAGSDEFDDLEKLIEALGLYKEILRDWIDENHRNEG